MEEYTEAKANILRFQENGTRAVLNYDNEITRALATRVAGEVTFVSTACKPDAPSAAYVEDGNVCLDGQPIMERSAILLPGRHNLENYLSATAALKGLVAPASIEKVARTFGGVEHRCELVRRLNGVRYYNSSIDSSPTRTMAALSNFPEKVIAICGGYDKHIPYEPLGTPLCRRAKVVLLTGATAPQIKEAVMASPAYAPGAPILVDCTDLADAVAKAHAIAKDGDVVLLSPASASFDSFKNFEERGKFFKTKVNELK